MNFAPIILFVYNKPEITRNTIISLQQNFGAEETDVFIYSDAAKKDLKEDRNIRNVELVRQMIKEDFRFKSVTVIEASVNKGLANSVISGVTEVLTRFEKAIILEDDVLTSKYFLTFMNSQLRHYQDDLKVAAIGSWNFYYPEASRNYFFRVPDSIGWAVFRRSWTDLNLNSSALAAEIQSRKLVSEFNVNGSYDFFGMLQKQSQGLVDSWAIRWYATNFLLGRLSIFPNSSLTKHVGFGEDATNCVGSEDSYFQTFDVVDNTPDMTKHRVIESKEAVAAFSSFNTRQINPTKAPFFARARQILNSVFKKI